MKIALAQTHAHAGDIDANILDHVAIVSMAVKHGCQFIIFPELSITGYQPKLADQLALCETDKRLKIFQNLADQNGIDIIIGAPIKTKNKPNIGLIIFQPNEKAYVHFKQHLHHSETNYFAPNYHLAQPSKNSARHLLRIIS